MTFSISSGAEENLYASIGNIQLESGGPGSGRHSFSPAAGDVSSRPRCSTCGKTKGHPNHKGMEDDNSNRDKYEKEHPEEMARLREEKKKASVKASKEKACNCQASWEAFKKDPTYDNYMRAHRVKAGKVEAMSPPGYGGTVQHMVKDHPQISNPYGLSWWLYEKGDKSHVKAPKGTGAKTVSKKVKEKRSKALKKKSAKK